MYSIKRVKKSELPKIIAWAKSKRNKDVNFEWMLKSEDARNFIVSWQDKEICVGSFNVSEAELIMFMRPRWHFKGRGRACLYFLEEWICRYYHRGFNYIFVEPCGDVAKKFFAKAGYQSTPLNWWVKYF